MTSTIIKIGDSQGLIFDAALMELAHLRIGEELAVTFQEGGLIWLTPLRPVIGQERAVSKARRLA